jgi:hypothetical protein
VPRGGSENGYGHAPKPPRRRLLRGEERGAGRRLIETRAAIPRPIYALAHAVT